MYLQRLTLKSKRNSWRSWKILKKLLNDEIDHLLYEDESMIRDYQAIQKTWFVKGRQKVIQTYGKHEGVKLLGILDYETGKVYVEDHKSYDAQVFMSFLGNVLKKSKRTRV